MAVERHEVPANNADLIVENSESVKSITALVGKTANVVTTGTGANEVTNNFVKNTKIVVPLKCLSNFWISLEMRLINCKIHLELNWIENCKLSRAGNSATFKITDAKLHVPLVNLSTKDNVNLAKQLSNGFKRSVYWSSYQTIPAKVINKGANLNELLSARLQGLKRLFVFAYVIDAGANNDSGIKNNKNYFLATGEIENYNVLIDRRSFYDQAIKRALSGLRQFWATESSLKKRKNAFDFTSKALFVLKILRFLA